MNRLVESVSEEAEELPQISVAEDELHLGYRSCSVLREVSLHRRHRTGQFVVVGDGRQVGRMWKEDDLKQSAQALPFLAQQLRAV